MALTFRVVSPAWPTVTVRGRSWRGGSSSERRRSWSRRRPSLVTVAPASRRRPGLGRPAHGEAGGLAGWPAGELGPAAGLAGGPLDEVGVPDAVVVLSWEPQVGGQALAVELHPASHG